MKIKKHTRDQYSLYKKIVAKKKILNKNVWGVFDLVSTDYDTNPVRLVVTKVAKESILGIEVYWCHQRVITIDT